ncbi:MAG: hypothetical protein IPI38_05355 [Gemmatimonadetes bacterium]|nr:hypothetical protein [Gemmatimonadota bacterium]MBK6778426.1 hypothetical protein [Gemmatimonadota bacterium]MBK7714830.1 hypothetical protein [Gemmatimonadota bacterium]MBK7924829.1 hypothetical protein [Gemmatimonadota bacterium]
MDDVAKILGILLAFGGAGTISYALIRLVNVFSRRLERASGPELQAIAAELDELRARAAGAEELQHRVAELEERLDFAERMLARQREPGALPGGHDG